jgi:hypothetical protein
MSMIERLLSEVRELGPEGSFDKETARALRLIHGFEAGIQIESELRLLLAKHIKLHRSLDVSDYRYLNYLRPAVCG